MSFNKIILPTISLIPIIVFAGFLSFSTDPQSSNTAFEDLRGCINAKYSPALYIFINILATCELLTFFMPICELHLSISQNRPV